MLMKKRAYLTTILAFAGAALGSATTYNVKLVEPTTVHGATLKPGDYKLDVDNGKAVFRQGKKTTEAPAKVETNGEKFRKTTLRYDKAGGELRLQQVDVGGSNVRVVFDD